jgi:hypothetical protein
LSVHIEGVSTREMAGMKRMSQTRVRQIVKRVVQWLALTLPPQSDLDEEREIRLSQKITADRLLFVYQEMMALWRSTHHSKYLSQTIRVSMAQARLGVLPGLTENLIADAESGDLQLVEDVPCQPEASARDTDDDLGRAPPTNPTLTSDFRPLTSLPSALLHQLNQVRNILSVQQEVDMAAQLLAAEVSLTPDQRAQAEKRRQGIPARLRAAGLNHLLPVFSDFLKTLPTASPLTSDLRPLTSHASPSSSPPPFRACSPNSESLSPTQPTSEVSAAPTTDAATNYSPTPIPTFAPFTPFIPPSPRLLTPSHQAAATHLQISPEQPGAIAKANPKPIATQPTNQGQIHHA